MTWRDEAACGTPPEGMETAWIDEAHPSKEIAEEICDSCPVRKLCLLDAVKDTRSQGLRAGMWFDTGRLWRKDRQKLLVDFGIQIARSRSREWTRHGENEEMHEVRRG